MSKAKNIVKLASSLPDSAVVPISSGGTGAITAAAALLALGAGGVTLKISSIAVTDSSYNTLDDTAVDVAGGYVKITGTGFASGCQVVVNQTPATSTTYISPTEVRAQLPATAAGTYIVYVVNADGGVAIRINGVSFSTLPAWTTTSPLPNSPSGDPISIQLAATAATTYTLAAGSTLPTGLTLSSTGLLSGTVSLAAETIYSFTITAIDAEAQDSPKTFTIIITVGEPYFRNTVLLLTGDGVNAGTNNTFLDSSSNNFAVTRTGTLTQGSVSPFSPTGWSTYFNGSTDYLSVPDNVNLTFGASNFTIEGWLYPIAPGQTNSSSILTKVNAVSNYAPYGISMVAGTYALKFYATTAIGSWNLSNGSDIGTMIPNTWNHFSVCRSGGNVYLLLNGQLTTTLTNFGTSTLLSDTNSTTTLIGGGNYATTYFNGYMSNLRIVKGTALYTANFIPSIAPLTAVANTSLLTLQSNRFKDNSTNALAITPTGTPSIQALSPFAPAATYSALTHGGSMYFNGTTDYLTVSNNTAFAFGTGDFTIEAWINRSGGSGNQPIVQSDALGLSNNDKWWFAVAGGGLFFGTHSSGGFNIVTTTTFNVETWNHVAVTRTSGVMAMFINGVSTAFTTSGTPSGYNLNQNGLTIGAMSTPSYWKGYVSNLRLIKGTAVYTANFTPPTAPVTAVTNTSLLLNGTSAAIYDATGKSNLNTVGDTKISTAVKKYGTGSISFDGSGDNLIGNMAPIGGGDFTIEFWMYRTVTTDTYIMVIGDDWGSSDGVQLIQYSNGYCMFVGTATANGFGTPINNAWTHIAITRVNGLVKLYQNGTAFATTLTNTSVLTSTTFKIGQGAGAAWPAFGGYIDDLRVTKGVARYIANFTPPTSAHILK